MPSKVVTKGLLALALAPAIALSFGCYTPQMYTGDGTMSSLVQGPSRYRVDLGSVELTRGEVVRHTLSGMPTERFIVGFEVSRKVKIPRHEARTRPLKAEVRIRLVNERHETVIDERRPLSEWTWTGSPAAPTDRPFVYLRGATSEIPIGKDGSMRVVEESHRPDGGWGTYFAPRRNGKYELVVEILSSDPNARDFEAKVVAIGGERLSL
jgi:hypothetical protein